MTVSYMYATLIGLICEGVPMFHWSYAKFIFVGLLLLVRFGLFACTIGDDLSGGVFVCQQVLAHVKGLTTKITVLIRVAR